MNMNNEYIPIQYPSILGKALLNFYRNKGVFKSKKETLLLILLYQDKIIYFLIILFCLNTFNFTNKPHCEKTWFIRCGASKGSDQSEHPCRLIRACAVPVKLQKSQGFPWRNIDHQCSFIENLGWLFINDDSYNSEEMHRLICIFRWTWIPRAGFLLVLLKWLPNWKFVMDILFMAKIKHFAAFFITSTCLIHLLEGMNSHASEETLLKLSPF